MVFVLAAGVCAADSSSADKIDLKFNLKQGQSYRMRMVMDQKISQTMQGQEQNINQKMVMGVGFDVQEVDTNGIISLKTTYQTLQVQMDGPMGTIEYDSTRPQTSVDPNDPNEQMARMITAIYDAMVGQSVIVKVTPKGKTLAIEGLDAMMAEMVEKMAAGDEAAKEAMKQMMENFASEDKVKEMSDPMMTPFPKEPVGIGDSWYDIATVSVGFPIDVDTTYILKARKDGVAVIDMISKIDLGNDIPLADTGPVQMSMQMAGTQAGSLEIDEATGWTIRGRISMQFTGVTKIAANEQMPEGMTIPMSMQGVITIEPIEEEPAED